MSSNGPGSLTNVENARSVSVRDIAGNTPSEVPVTPADRRRLVRFLLDHGGRNWLPK